MYAVVEPVKYRTGEATCLVVRGVTVMLGDRANIDWILASPPRKEFESGTCLLTGSSYSSWNEDDHYIYTWLCNQLNLTLTSIEPGNFWSTP